MHHRSTISRKLIQSYILHICAVVALAAFVWSALILQSVLIAIVMATITMVMYDVTIVTMNDIDSHTTSTRESSDTQHPPSSTT